MIASGIELMEETVGRLLGRPEENAAGEGSPLERAIRAAEGLGFRAVASVPPSGELAAAAARAARRGPYLVVDAGAGSVLGFARGEKPETSQLLAWRAGATASLEAGVELLLEGGSERLRERARRRLAASRPATELPSCAIVGFEAPGWRFEIAGRLFLALALEIAGIGLFVAGWWVLGAAAFQGGASAGWMGIWTLLAALRALFASAAGWQRTVAFQELAESFRRRIFDGLLRGGDREAAADSGGDLLGGLAEIEQLEGQVHHGGLGLVLGLAEIAAALALFARGAAPLAGSAALMVGLAMLALAATRLFVATESWVATRVALTRGAVGRLARHRLRWLFGDTARERRREDQELAAYTLASKKIDDAALIAAGLPYRLALVGGILALAPALVTGAEGGGAAVGVLGSLLAAAAVGRLADACQALALARSSLRRLRRLLGPVQAATGAGGRDLSLAPARPIAHLHFRGHQARRGDKLRLPPVAGGDASVAEPTRLDGLTPLVLGEDATSRRLGQPPAAASELLLSGSLAFNLLAGRSWPPSSADLAAAETLCRDLGLDEVAGRREGLAQPIGEGGRPLSDGETARVLLARSLLRDPDFLVLEDPLAPLDPPLRATVAARLAAAEPGILVSLPEEIGETKAPSPPGGIAP